MPRLPSTLKPAEPEPIIRVVWERVTLELNLALRAAVFLLAALLIAVRAPTGAIAAGAPSFAPKPSKGSPETALPAEVQALFNLLADPKVQAWLAEHGKIETAPLPPNPARELPAEMISTEVEAAREHIAEMAAAVPSMPAQFAHATDVLEQTIGGHRAIRILSLVAAFVALGYGAEALFWCATRRMRRDIETHSVDTVGDRVRLVGERAAFALASVVAYAVGSIGAFLIVHWPGLLRHIVLSYLIVFLAVRMAGVLGRFLLAPHNERFRVIPTNTVTARYWHLRLRSDRRLVGVCPGVSRTGRDAPGGHQHRGRHLGAVLDCNPNGSLVAPAVCRWQRNRTRGNARNPPVEVGQAQLATDIGPGTLVGAARSGNDASLLAGRRCYRLASGAPIDPESGRASPTAARHR